MLWTDIRVLVKRKRKIVFDFAGVAGN